MAFKAKTRVVEFELLTQARAEIDGGNYHGAARLINDFCARNYTMQGEAGEKWGRLKATALTLLGNVTKGAVRSMIGKVWKDIIPTLKAV